MRTIADLSAQADTLTLDELQNQKNLRDEVVAQMRAEMGQIHALMEPKWEAEQRAMAGPANLSQRVGISLGN